jgi:hypothetical protein
MEFIDKYEDYNERGYDKQFVMSLQSTEEFILFRKILMKINKMKLS